ncbi:OmpA family protein [Pendulispora rubella]|uniref:OmpA family protein n=1 Tax=Pendulispora rubella TaxID=2741070 RepID=A0ABZ2KYA0_9BACT
MTLSSTQSAHGKVRSPQAAALRMFAWVTLVVVCVFVGCGGPKWPNCDNDEHCNAEGHKGVCLNGKCVDCRDDKGCATGQKCESGQCLAVVGYCDDKKACPGGAPCVNNRCQDKVAEVRECSDEKPCPQGSRCENGHCVKPPQGGPGCSDFPAPKFDFEQSTLRDMSKQTLTRLVGCLTTGPLKGSRVLLTGHCDNRGEYEFNMSLGAERAEVIKNFLAAAGVGSDRVATSSRGKLDAVGTDEAGWENDRRVDIEIR